MSAATELSTSFDVAIVDVPRRSLRAAGRLASVTVLHPPGERAAATPLRLTRRGAGLLGCAAALLAGLLLWLAHASAPQPAGARQPVPATVTVGSGDSLWSIATRAAPDRDPRAEVAELQRLNHLTGVVLVPGQVLRTR